MAEWCLSCHFQILTMLLVWRVRLSSIVCTLRRPLCVPQVAKRSWASYPLPNDDSWTVIYRRAKGPTTGEAEMVAAIVQAVEAPAQRTLWTYAREPGDTADVDVALVEHLVARRSMLRHEKNYKAADEIRRRLKQEHDVSIYDEGLTWFVGEGAGSVSGYHARQLFLKYRWRKLDDSGKQQQLHYPNRTRSPREDYSHGYDGGDDRRAARSPRRPDGRRTRRRILSPRRHE